jgi:hypothetical protein
MERKLEWLSVCLLSVGVSLHTFGAEERKGPEADESALVAMAQLGAPGQAGAGSSAGPGVLDSTDLVEVRLSDGVVSMPAGVRDSFDFLKVLHVGSGKSFKPGQNIESDKYLSKESLRLLVALMTGANDAADYDFETLVYLVCLADQLQINDWKRLMPVLKQVKKLVTPALVAKVVAALPKIRVPLDINLALPMRRLLDTGESIDVELQNINEFYWQPDGKGYVVLFIDGSLQRYNLSGEAQGLPLFNVDTIFGFKWQPDGKGYEVLFRDHTWQRFNIAGESQGEPLASVDRVKWQPDRKGYGVKFRDYRWQRYNLAGEPQGPLLANVANVEWQPDINGYGVKFRDYSWQRYNLAGEPQGPLLANVDNVEWQPDRKGYGVKFRDYSWQQGYGDILDYSWQRYNLAGEPQGPLLNNVGYVQWLPDSKGYWVSFMDLRWQIYDMAGKYQGVSLKNVKQVRWQPNGTWFSALFEDSRLVIYQPSPQIARAFFDAQLIVQSVLNKIGDTKERVKLPLSLQRLLGKELVSILELNGYIDLVPPSYFRALGIDTTSRLLALRQNGAGAGAGSA